MSDDRDPEHQPETLVACMQRLGRKYPHAGYGKILSRWLMSDHPQLYDSFGNGSAIRVSPVGLYANSLEEALELARITASVLHNHPEGIKGAQAIAGCVILHKNISLGEEDEIRRFVTEEIGYNLNFNLDDIRNIYSFGVTCQGRVLIAIKAYLERSSYPAEIALQLAISMGGDSDTIVAMTASIASAASFSVIGGGFRDELVNQCRALLPSDLLDINDRRLQDLYKQEAVHYDTAAQHQWLIRGIPHQAQGIDFCICFFQLTQDFPSEP